MDMKLIMALEEVRRIQWNRLRAGYRKKRYVLDREKRAEKRKNRTEAEKEKEREYFKEYMRKKRGYYGKSDSDI